MYSQAYVTGNVELYSGDFTYEEFERFTPEQKNRYLMEKGKNLAVDSGLQQLLLLAIGSNTNSFTLCGVGSGVGTPVNTDTMLGVTIGTNTINSKYITGNTAYFNTFFGKNDGNGSWNETGLFTTGNVMLCRRKFTSTFTKDISKAAVISWSISLTATADV